MVYVVNIIVLIEPNYKSINFLDYQTEIIKFDKYYSLVMWRDTIFKGSFIP